MTETTFFEPPTHPLFALVVSAAKSAMRYVLIGIGWVVVVAGVIIAPLPGPFGVPIIMVGLILILRNSYPLRRAFVRLQHKYPRFIFPIRRLLRKNPEIAAVAYQQALRVEKFLLPKRWRAAKDVRRRYFRRKRAAALAA
jgi:hypothetical protein